MDHSHVPLLVIATLGMAITAASAADIPSRTMAIPPAPMLQQLPAFTWTGFYVGANIGWAGGGRPRQSAFVTPPGTGLNDIGGGRRNAVAPGLQAGYNWQVGNLVAGIETDIQALLSGKHSLGPTTLPDGTIVSGRSNGGWYGTLRPRVGYAFDRTLLYVTGGLAYGQARNSLTSVDPGGNTASLHSDRMRTGWTLGTGVEYAFSRNWSAKLEYQYVNFGATNMAGAVIAPGGLPTGTTINTRTRDDFHTIKAGINYRF